VTRARAAGGGKASKGRTASRGSPRAADRATGRHVAGGNAVNPRIGSGMQQARTVEEEQTVEVVRNHEGGTRTRLVAASRRRRQRCRRREWTPRPSRWRGVLWTTPGEEARQRCRAARTGQPSGETAPRSRGARTHIFTGERAARSTDPRGSAPAFAGGQGRGGRWRSPTSPNVDRTGLPPLRAPLRRCPVARGSQSAAMPARP